MKQQFAFAWIDDTSSRKKLLAHLIEGAPPGITTQAPLFVELIKGKKQKALADFLALRKAPSLVVIDQVLNKCEWELNIPLLGSSLAEIIRQKWPGCPIVGITAGQNISDESQWYDFEKRAEFEQLIEEEHFSDAIELIYALTSGFFALRNTKQISSKSIIKLLETPAGEKQRIAAALPDEIRSPTKDKSTPRLTALWIRKRLMNRPGFLYDTAWTANSLGLSVPGFQKVEHRFVAAKYHGLFAQKHKPFWWPLSVKEILFETIKDAKTHFSWCEGQRLPGLSEADFSKCYVCGKAFPEIIGYIDTSSHEKAPMHIRCTTPDPRFQSLLYFDDLRVMKD